MRHCLKQVMVECIFGKRFKVYSIDGSLIGELDIRISDKHKRPPHPEHERINEGYRKKKEAYRSESLRRFIERFKGEGEVFIEGLKKAVTANMYWHIEEILKLTEIYNTHDIIIAMKECNESGSYHKNSIKRLLDGKPLREIPIESINSSCIIPSIDIRRPLSAYRVGGKEVLR